MKKIFIESIKMSLFLLFTFLSTTISLNLISEPNTGLNIIGVFLLLISIGIIIYFYRKMIKEYIRKNK